MSRDDDATAEAAARALELQAAADCLESAGFDPGRIPALLKAIGGLPPAGQRAVWVVALRELRRQFWIEEIDTAPLDDLATAILPAGPDMTFYIPCGQGTITINGMGPFPVNLD